MSDNDPFKSHREMIEKMERVSNPFKYQTDFIKQIERLNDPFKPYQEMIEKMERVSNPFKYQTDLMKQIERLNDPFKSHREMIEKMERVSNPFKYQTDFIKQIERLNDPFKPYQEMIEKMERVSNPFKYQTDFIKQIERFNDPFKPYREMVERVQTSSFNEAVKVLGQINSLVEKNQIELSKLVVNDDNTFTVEETNISFEEVGYISNRVNESFQIETTQNLERLYLLIIEELKKLGSPKKQNYLLLIFSLLLCPLAVSVMTLYIDHHYFDKPPESPRQIIKEVKRSTPLDSIRSLELREFRFVKCEILLVRTKPKSKSAILGQIYIGQTVRLIKKDGDWSLVERVDESTDLKIQGWVNSRYIEKFH
ncbi:SH3 domain-containing protein [Methylophilus sp. 13]|uniref:SH3 domain-containing protein n=1 Tax=Methylophilus sp. 13 TaxID=2781018 RepID=UPI0018904B48|nr:SH3 domain-containing protein [Methylophilus sp. 13]MBF5039166.1 SH3 domain-containing protein [Methylophilus sp. 13]